jgi:hypothetical protein
MITEEGMGINVARNKELRKYYVRNKEFMSSKSGKRVT